MKYFTKQWSLIAEGNIDIVRDARQKYREYWNSVRDQLPTEFTFAKESMHDSYIVKAYHCGDDFVMEIDSTNGFTDVSKLIFKNATVKDFVFHPNMWWEQTEIYLLDGMYSIQFLTQYGYMLYEENEIIAEDIIIEREFRDYKAMAREIQEKVDILRQQLFKDESSSND